jgi:hypothetical protein
LSTPRGGLRFALLAMAVALAVAACGNVAVRPAPTVAPAAPAEIRWTVTAPDGPLKPRVALCWTGGAPRSLLAPTAPAQAAVQSIASDDGSALTPTERGWSVVGAADAGCVRYALDWSWTAFRHQDPDVAVTFGDDVVVGADMLFLRPSPRREAAVRKVRFDTGEVGVSAPFAPLEDGWRALPLTTFTRKGYVALGRFRTERIPVADGMMELAVLDVGIDAGRGTLNRWAYEAGRASAQLHGVLPTPFVQVLVGAPPMTPTSKPVLFGIATRGGGAGVNIIMSTSPDEGALVGEWVAVHELAHHGLPYLKRGERWISEGMATYYQFMLRVRSGVLDDAIGWADLLQGARTAAAGPTTSYRWLYWGGAMGALRADVELRANSDGAWSLDRALTVFRQQHDLSRRYEAADVVEKLDAIVGDGTFGRWQQARADGEAFARFETLFEQLGVEAGVEGPATLDDGAPLAWARKAIQAPVLR